MKFFFSFLGAAASAGPGAEGGGSPGPPPNPPLWKLPFSCPFESSRPASDPSKLSAPNNTLTAAQLSPLCSVHFTISLSCTLSGATLLCGGGAAPAWPEGAPEGASQPPGGGHPGHMIPARRRGRWQERRRGGRCPPFIWCQQFTHTHTHTLLMVFKGKSD